MKRILLIDDKRNIPADVIARTFQDGINALKCGPWDVLYLDHDLGSEVPTETGYDILRWLEENMQYLPQEIILVTSNPPGRQKMKLVVDKLYGRL